MPVQETDACLRLVASLGTGSFLAEFAHQCAALSRADQVTTFSVEAGRVRCVFAHRPGQDELASALCQRYVTSFVARDQILASRLQRRDPAYASVTVRSDDIADAAYRSRLFTDAGLAGKIALLAADSSRCLYLNFYYRDFASAQYGAGSECIQRAGRLLVGLLRKHETLSAGLLREEPPRHRAERYLRERLPMLSKREREVCAAILCGYSLERISCDLGLSHSTIKTFRKRAYGKLSIHKQSGLFARCTDLLV